MKTYQKLAIAALVCGAALTNAGDVMGIRIGSPAILPQSTPTASTAALSVAASKVGFIFMASDAAVVTHLGFRYTLRTGTPVQHRITLQTVDGSGLPSASILAAAAFTPPADATWNNTVQYQAITNDSGGGSITDYTLARGTYYSIVVEPCPGATAPCSGTATPDGSNFSTYTTAWQNFTARPANSYALTHNGTSWTKQTADQPAFMYKSASKSYGFPMQGTTSTTISSGAETAMSFTIPCTEWATFKISGMQAVTQTPAAAKSTKVVLYTGTTVLQTTAALDSDINTAAASGHRLMTAYWSDVSLATLACGTLYRVGITPQDASNNVALATLDLAAAGDRTAFPGGTIFALSSRTGCGAPCDSTSTAWAADTTTSRPFMNLIFEDITAPSGSGGQHGYVFIQ